MQDSNTQDNDSQWGAVLEALLRSSPTSFKTNFLGSRARIDGDRLIVSLPDSANAEWVENRQSGVVKRIVKSAYGREFDIEFRQGKAEPVAVDTLEAEPVKQTPVQVRGFTPVVDSLSSELGLITSAIYGVVWRYCQMNSHTCYASQKTIGERLGLTRITVNKHLKILEDKSYIRCLNPDAAASGETKVYIVTNKVEVFAAMVIEANVNKGV